MSQSPVVARFIVGPDFYAAQRELQELAQHTQSAVTRHIDTGDPDARVVMRVDERGYYQCWDEPRVVEGHPVTMLLKEREAPAPPPEPEPVPEPPQPSWLKRFLG